MKVASSVLAFLLILFPSLAQTGKLQDEYKTDRYEYLIATADYEACRTHAGVTIYNTDTSVPTDVDVLVKWIEFYEAATSYLVSVTVDCHDSGEVPDV